MLLVANFSQHKRMQKSWISDWNPGTRVLIWDYSARAIQWIPTWLGFENLCNHVLWTKVALALEGLPLHANCSKKELPRYLGGLRHWLITALSLTTSRSLRHLRKLPFTIDCRIVGVFSWVIWFSPPLTTVLIVPFQNRLSRNWWLDLFCLRHEECQHGLKHLHIAFEREVVENI